MAANPVSGDEVARAFDDEEVATAFRVWEESTGREITLPEDYFITRGFTDAYVASVMVHAASRGEHDRHVIAKIMPVDKRREIKAHRTALDQAGEYGRRHLVELWYHPITVGLSRILYFQDIAGGTTRHQPAGRLCAKTQSRHLADLVRTVAEGVAGEWNTQVRLARTKVSVGEFAFAEMNYLASGESTVDAVAAATGLDAISARSVVLPDGTVCPNPYLLCTGWLPQSERQLQLLYGFSHGDLHLDNIMLHVDDLGPHPETYRLIDLSTYEDDAPRSRDQVMLLLSMVTRFLPDLTDLYRQALSAKLCLPDLPGEDRRESILDEVISDVFSITSDIVHGPGFGLQWHEQYLVQLTATALRFTSFSGLKAADRWWFLCLACAAARQYFQFHRLDIDASAPVRLSNPFRDDDPDTPLVPRSQRRPDGFVLGTPPGREDRPADGAR